jgi:hypothetical protein
MKTENSLIKLLPVLALAGILPVCATIRAHAEAQVAHIHANGDFAQVTWSTVDDTTHLLTYTNIGAHRTGNSTFLFINAQQDFDPTTGHNNLLFGYGLVPSSVLSVTGPMATISIELANVPDFTLAAYVYDQDFNLISATPVSNGSINVSFTKNGFFSTTSRLSNATAYPPFPVPFQTTVRQQTDASYDSASSNGTFLGTVVPPNADAIIGTERSNEITITRN